MSVAEFKAVISKQLLVEHSRANTEIVQEYIGSDQNKMKALVDILLLDTTEEDNLKLHQRGAYALNLIGEKNPEMVNPHLKQLFTLLPNPPHEAFSRGIMRIYAFHPVPRKWQGVMVDLGFTYLQDPKTPVAVKIFSMSVLLAIGRQEQDLLPELEMTINEYYEHGTVGYKSRAKRTLKEIRKILNRQN